jgi:hypothetical protein
MKTLIMFAVICAATAAAHSAEIRSKPSPFKGKEGIYQISTRSFITNVEGHDTIVVVLDPLPGEKNKESVGYIEDIKDQSLLGEVSTFTVLVDSVYDITLHEYVSEINIVGFTGDKPVYFKHMFLHDDDPFVIGVISDSAVPAEAKQPSCLDTVKGESLISIEDAMRCRRYALA